MTGSSGFRYSVWILDFEQDPLDSQRQVWKSWWQGRQRK